MRRTKLFVGTLLAAGFVVAFAASKKDPVLMKVDGKPVTLSEFEYMYHKNNQQQVAQQPLEKYLDMFVTYKLKVADAEAAGIDTTAAFKKEYEATATSWLCRIFATLLLKRLCANSSMSI
ncbi:MAG: hypothetical protein L6U61_00360 [Bacteroidales bacterium]|nr:MAG: hypothetical protein L6U61_00360 [Bacteroidales bacterium]